MSKVQVIEQDGKRVFYVVPADIWERVKGAVEDAEDAAAYAEAVARDDGVRYPAAVALAIFLNFYNNRSSNAMAESFNAKIKLFRANLRGVADKKFFLFRIANLYAYPH